MNSTLALAIGRTTLILGLPAVVGSCHLFAKGPTQNRAANQEEVGSTQIAVLAVKRLDEYREELQPTFAMRDGDAARAEVIPETARFQESVRDALGVQLAAALPTEIGSTTETITSGTAQPPVVEKEKVTVSGSGDPASTPNAPGAPTDHYDRLKLPTNFFDTALRRDPMLEYLAATALYQEVKLLNTYVRDASIGDGYQAYIVRLQVAVQPRRRNQPYDTYVTFSFFLKDEDVGVAAKDAPDDSHLALQAKVLESFRTPSIQQNPVRILPLLVTDNLESALVSRSSQVAREIGLAVLGTIGTVGAEAGVVQAYEELSSQLTQDLNSLFMISRVSDNTVQVRLGASHVGADAYSMTARTHNVTLLVMMPPPAEGWSPTGLTCAAKTVFVDADSGDPPPRATESMLARTIQAKARGKDEKAVIDAVRRNDRIAFIRALQGSGLRSSEERSLWLDLAYLSGSEGGYAELDIELPRDPNPDLAANQTALLMDDGKVARVELRLGDDLDRVVERLTATLEVRKRSKPQESGASTTTSTGHGAASGPANASVPIDTPAAPTNGTALMTGNESSGEAVDPEHRLAARSIVVTRDGRGLAIDFPSLIGTKLISKDGAGEDLTLRIDEEQRGDRYSSSPPLCRAIKGVVLVKTEPSASSRLRLEVSLTRIPLLDGKKTCDVQVEIPGTLDGWTGPVILKVTDAAIDDESPAVKSKQLEKKSLNSWLVARPTDNAPSFSIRLSSMEVSTKVILQLLVDGDEADKKELEIVRKAL